MFLFVGNDQEVSCSIILLINHVTTLNSGFIQDNIFLCACVHTCGQPGMPMFLVTLLLVEVKSVLMLGVYDVPFTSLLPSIGYK